MAIKEKKNKNGISYEVGIYLPLELQKQFKRERIYKRFVNLKDAEKWERQKTKEVDSGYLTVIEDINMSEASESYINEVKNKWSPSSVRTYNGFIKNYFIPVFKDKPLNKISSSDIQRFSKMISGLDLTEKTKHNITTGLRSLFKWCVDKGYMEDYIFNDIPSYSQKPTRTRDFITVDEIKLLIPLIEYKPVRDFIMFMTFTGLRISEVCGLRFCDINFHKHTLTVKNQIYHTKESEKGYILINPKCNNISTIVLNKIAYSILEKQNEKEGIKSDDFIFVDYNNEPYRKDGFVRFQFENAVEKMKEKGLIDKAKNITFHSLRHSYASMLVHLNENIHTVQSLLRHKDFKLTYNTYAHLYPDCSPKSFDAIDKEFDYLVK
jgi:integrase